MATDCVDGDYLGAYARFFAEFVARVNPDDQLPVKVSGYDIGEGEIVGEIINVTLQYLNQTYCPPSLQSYIVYLVIQAIKSTCKKQPEICGLRQQERAYAPLKLMQAVTNEVNEICRRYLDNSRLALLPPPSSTPQVVVGATRNARRKMEDRHVVLHDLHTIFNIQDDTIANYYAVFDGHGGQDAAAYCATHLHQYLVESVHYPTDPERALRDAFLTTDAQFIAKSSTRRLNGGTTAVCVLVMDKKLHVAWVGDSMASLVKRGCVKQLVNPHRPAREDEQERINNMGGVVINCAGVLRVNGFLNISRAIGDVSHKPFVTGEPEIRCVSLDGTEDFLIIACDGLWDHVDPRTAAQRVYRQVLQSPHDLKYVQQTLLQCAKRAGSLDNITVIVVFLTPPTEIASRPLNAHPLLSYPVPNGLLNNMDPNNPFLSNVNGQFDVNAAFVKQQQKLDADLQHENGTDALELDDNRRLIYATGSSNGKHVEDVDGNDDYDYGDLGPETDVDAVDDAPDVRDRLSRELFPDDEKPRRITSEGDNNVEDDDDDDDDDDEDDDLNRDNANVRRQTYDEVDVMDNRIRGQSDEDVYGADDDVPRDNKDDDVSQPPRGVVDSDARVAQPDVPDVVDDDDESPPSPPRAAKPLQHVLIPEADNVADSEDSEDEWNYYRIDPNKEESVTAAAAAPGDEEKNVREDPELVVKDNSEVQSLEEADDIKCERRTEEAPSELIDTDISNERELREEPEKQLAHSEEEEEEERQDQEADMDFQLNPNAAEFVPTAVSPTLMDRRNIVDFPISGSPLKQTALAMDDIPVPTQSEFEEEVSHRPRETDEKDYTNGDHENLQSGGLDVSEISSTRAELGDESIARIMATTQQWSGKIREGDTGGPEEYDIATDPMAMSFAPGDLEAAFERGVDLNAVHDLSGTENEAEANECYVPMNSTPPRSPEPYANDAHSPFLNEKPDDLLHASSTPHPDGKSSPSLTADEISSLAAEQQQTLLMEQDLGVCPLEDDRSSEHEAEKPEQIDRSQQLLEEVSENAQFAVSDLLLEAPNPAEFCAKGSSLSPMQDTLESASPQPVEEETTAISSVEAESTSGALLASSPLHVPDFTPSRQHDDLDSFAPDFVSSTSDASGFLQDPLDSKAAASSTVAQDTGILSFTEEPAEVTATAVDQQPWESDVCAMERENNTVTPAATARQESANEQSLLSTEAEESATLMDYVSQADKLSDARMDETKITTDFYTNEDIDRIIDLMAPKEEVAKLEPTEPSCHESIFKADEATTLASVDLNLSDDFPAQERIVDSSVGELAASMYGESVFKAEEEAPPANVDVSLPADLPGEIVKDSAELVDLDFGEPMLKAGEEETAVANVDDVAPTSDTTVSSPFANLLQEQAQCEMIRSVLLDNVPTETSAPSSVLPGPEKEKQEEEPAEVASTSDAPAEEEEAIIESAPMHGEESVEPPADIVAKVDEPKTETITAAGAVAEATTAAASTATGAVTEVTTAAAFTTTGAVTEATVAEEAFTTTEAVTEATVAEEAFTTTGAVTEATVAEEASMTTGAVTEATVAEEASMTTGAVTEAMAVEEASMTTEPVTEVMAVEEASMTSGAVTEATVAEEVSMTTGAVTEATVAEEASMMAGAVTETTVAEEASMTTGAVTEATVAEEASMTAGAVTEATVAEEAGTTTGAVTEITVAEEAGTTTGAVTEATVAEEAGMTTGAVTEAMAVEEASMTTEPVTEVMAVEEASMTSGAVTEATVAEEVSMTTGAVTEATVAEEASMMAGAVTETTVAEEASMTTGAVTEATVAEEAGMTTGAAAVTAVAAAAAATAAVGAVVSSAKTTKSATAAKRPTKTTVAATTTKASASTTKVAASTKSTPTSPSKAAVGSTAARTTSTTSAAAARKPAARPKQLDGPARSAVSSSTAKSVAKTTTAKAAATSTKSTAMTSRVSSGTTKARTTATSPKLSAISSSSGAPDKKSTTANGDAKQLAGNKPPIAAKSSTTSKSATSNGGTKATALVVKSSSTTSRTSMSTVAASKPRPVSASAAVKTSSTTAPASKPTSGVNTSSSRPKTAPVSSGVAKSRDNTAKASTVKSPMIDKQIKETANKRIFLGRSTTGASSTAAPKAAGRVSAPAAAKSRASSGKSPSAAAATSPIKKITKVAAASKLSTTPKTTPSSNNKAKALPNGVPDSTVANNVISAMMTNDKLVVDDDVPRKDASPVDVPTDNQLIVTAD
ncbi:PREDICTED: mucin-19-like isoform X2 [Dinoponera quadriceps]|uniref:Mucin-19-like isoform X2 n=1 Tax=Dinoponera quadriceps TaxID=609295 RepID=A0A6P3XPB1_DINQU|nr:PREDICTED: mucin-19-like isoform X2 [Dinoponera quadriceps]